MASKKSKKAKKGTPASRPSKPERDESRDAAKASDDATTDDAAAEDEEATAEPEAKQSEPAPPRSRSRKTVPGRGKSKGVLALFDHPDVILSAAKKARDQGYVRWDVYTPFPVHGMDDAMGLGPSKVPWITFGMGVVGLCMALVIQFGTMVYSWPLNFGGKPAAAWPSFVPISFEMTVLLAGVSTAIGALFLGGVLKLRKLKPHRDITSHRFAIFVESSDPKYDEEKAIALFEKAGAIEVGPLKEGE